MKEIQSAEEFCYLRESEIEAEYSRAAEASAAIQVWKDVIDNYPAMRKCVAHNKTVPIEILEILSVDEDETVRSWVAGKRKLTRQLFERLAKDPSAMVRQDIVTNPKTPFDIRASLAWDPNSDVLVTAHRALSYCEPAARDQNQIGEGQSGGSDSQDLELYRWLRNEIKLGYERIVFNSFENQYGYLTSVEPRRPAITRPVRSKQLREVWLYAAEYFSDFSDGLGPSFRGKPWAEARVELSARLLEVGRDLGLEG